MVGQWADQGLFEDLTALAAANDVTPDQFYPFAWAEASLDGKLYAMPFDTDNRAMFYNSRLLGEAGIDPPRTIAELEVAMEALTIRDGPRFEQIGLVPWFSQGFLYTWAGAFGAEFLDSSGRVTFDDPRAIEALEWMVSMADFYGIEAITDFTNAADAGDINPFRGELFAMMVSGPWEVAGIANNTPDLQYGVTSIPTPDGSIARTMAGGWSHIVPMGANSVEGGFAFARYMTLEEGAVAYGENTTHFMTAIDINENLSWAQDDIFQVFVQGFPYSFNRPVISQGQLLWDLHLTAQNDALNHVDTPENLLVAMTAQVNRELGFAD
jgi:multiple sugar transport system substrate-binding protein